MKTFFKIITFLFIVCVTVTDTAEDNKPHKVNVYINTNAAEKVDNSANYGDLVVGEKQDKDILLYREVFINNINETSDQSFVLSTKTSKYKFSNIRFLNIGRQIVLYSDYKLKDGSKLEINFAVRKNEQAHVWIELYGNRTSAILSSGVLIILTNIIYVFINYL